jgi:hypothetical protein
VYANSAFESEDEERRRSSCSSSSSSVSICTFVPVKQVNRVPAATDHASPTFGGALPSYLRHTSAYVSIRQHTSAYVSIRQHTSAYVSIRQNRRRCAARGRRSCGVSPYQALLFCVDFFLNFCLTASPTFSGALPSSLRDKKKRFTYCSYCRGITGSALMNRVLPS